MLTPSQYWDREATNPVTPVHAGWMAHPLVRHYINQSISGKEGGWPLDWFQGTYKRKFRRALSIGCGTGALERDLVRRDIVESVQAFDASGESLRIARETADSEGFGARIHYREGDFDNVELPHGEYDLICFHQSLHHVRNLERLLSNVHRALTADGLLYLDEFVGPSRTDWNLYAIRWYSALYQLFPRQVRYFDQFAMPIQEEDPSEAIRSADILSCLSIGFRIEHFRGYGGNILAMMFPDLLVHELSDEMVAALIRSEQSLLAAGERSFHAVITAQPKRGPLRRLIARSRYRIEPRVPRLMAELRALKRHYRERSRS
jgi:SAM-dependent methyltransferase